jgi:hypothetical protein
VKQIVSVSLGSSSNDYAFETEFLGQDFMVKRFGTDGDQEAAARLLLKWDKEAAAIGLGHLKYPYGIGPRYLARKHADKIKASVPAYARRSPTAALCGTWPSNGPCALSSTNSATTSTTPGSCFSPA